MKTPGRPFTAEEVEQLEAVAAFEWIVDQEHIQSRDFLHAYVANRIMRACMDDCAPLPPNWRQYRNALVADIVALVDHEINNSILCWKLDVSRARLQARSAAREAAIATGSPPLPESSGGISLGPAGGG